MIKQCKCGFGFLFLLLILCQSIFAKDLEYTNDFNRFLRLPGKGMGATIRCKNGGDVPEIYFDVHNIGTLGEIMKEEIKDKKLLGDLQKLKASGVQSNEMTYSIIYCKVDAPQCGFRGEIGILQKISKTHVAFPLADGSNEIHLELTDPDMPLYKQGRFPKNRYTLEEMEGGSVDIVLHDAVRLWDTANINEKMTCDMVTLWEDSPAEPDYEKK
ncbi:MAG: hypothetical protein LBN33_09630 [Desulfovibrio sp.]|nr:hypothetical protein [Desulfovibrio sp.]